MRFTRQKTGAQLLKRLQYGLTLLLISSICSITVSEVGYADGLALAPQTTTNGAIADEHIASTLTVSFRQDFAKVIDEAQEYVQKHKLRKAAVVLDLDETLLDNRAYYVRHKTFTPEQWHTWVIQSEAAAIPETLEFVGWLNKHRVNVFFVSGRLESERALTVANLNKIGVEKYSGLYLRPDGYSASSMKNFKVSAQEDIQQKGYKILLLLGDQDSDMRSALGKGFKLPNPIYTVP